MEYKIEVTITPDYNNSPICPYFWCILGRNGGDWHNCGHGWAKSPREAWRQACEYYDDITLI